MKGKVIMEVTLPEETSRKDIDRVRYLSKGTIECKLCENCEGNVCMVYGPDPVAGVKKCAEDAFRNYKRRKKRV